VCRRVVDDAYGYGYRYGIMNQADDRRTDEYLAETSRPKDTEEVEPKDEMKDP
jgi:hypothetical protein